MINNILLDMDGVLSDFFKPTLNQLNFKYPDKAISEEQYREKPTFDMATKFGISDAEFWGAINYDGFWESLPIFPWAKDLLYTLTEIAPVTIASSPSSSNPRCITEKVIWLSNNLNITTSDCLFGSKKYLMAKPGTVLIDDYEKNTREFKENGGEAILLPSSWNTDMSKINPVNFVQDQLRKLV